MLLALIMLTQLDGNPIWVESTQVIIIKPSHTGQKTQCSAPAKATLRIGSTGLCVLETPAQVMEKIK